MIRVVVIDDHPTFRHGVRAVLGTYADVELVGEAADGAAGLDLIEQVDPDVALVDLAMPGIGGVELTRRLAEVGRCRVVVLTMDAGEDAVVASLRAGATGYLLKDADPDAIAGAVRAAAAGNAYLGAAVAGRVAAWFAAPGTTTARPFPELTDRELEILDVLASGADNATIARRLFLSDKTVRNYVSAINAKLRVSSRAELVVRAREAGLGQTPG